MHYTLHIQSVAYHLQTSVQDQTTAERDAFARSAYNRYYYACFLLLREVLTEMNPGWETTVHKDYPALLNGKISKRFRTENARASKSGDFELQDLIQTSLKATSQIAEIMTEAYSIRLTADYQPNVSVLFSDDQSFSLNDIDINQAQEWYATLSTLLPTLQSAWKQIDA